MVQGLMALWLWPLCDDFPPAVVLGYAQSIIFCSSLSISVAVTQPEMASAPLHVLVLLLLSLNNTHINY